MSEDHSKRPVGHAGRLSDFERESLSTTALELKARGAINTQIGKELGVSADTVRRLLQYAAGKVDDDAKDRVRASVEASVNAVKRRAWTELDRRVPLTESQKKRGLDPKKQPRIIQPTSHTLPQLLARVLESDDRLIRLYGLDLPDANEEPTASLADQMKAYDKAKREGKLHEIRPMDENSANGSIGS